MKLTRRQFVKGITSTGVFVFGSRLIGAKQIYSNIEKSRIFKVEPCPVHDGQLRHKGVDTLLELLAIKPR